MPLYNFSDLQVSTSASNNDQILLRLDNSLSGAEGFSRITFSKFENSLNFLKSGGTINGNVTINGTMSSNFIRATSANIDIVNITNYELSGFSILSGGLTVEGTISSNNIVYASGGNSNQWNSAFTTVQNSSGNWDGVSSLSATAWVDKLGNDSTGEIGNIQKPYLTMQSAFNAGAKMFHIGLGTFTGITTAGNIDISFIGSGLNKTTINTISASNSISNSYSINIQDLGVQSVLIDTVQSIGEPATDPSISAGNGGNAKLNNTRVNTINNWGGNGAAGTYVNNGSNGGNSGGIEIKNICYISTINSYGGNGGSGFDSNGYGGNGGSSSGISGDILYMYSVEQINCYGGTAGNTDIGGSYSSIGGTPGNISLRNLEIAGNLNIYTGISFGSSPAYPPAGTLTLKKGYINALNMSREGASDPGYINAQYVNINNYTGSSEINGSFIFINDVDGSPTINAVVSYIDGVPYGT